MTKKDFYKGMIITVVKMGGLAILAAIALLLLPLLLAWGGAEEQVPYINGGVIGAMIFSCLLQVVEFNRRYSIPFIRKARKESKEQTELNANKNH